MQSFLNSLTQLSTPLLGMIFVLENILIAVFVVACGNIIQKRFTGNVATLRMYQKNDWILCCVTILLNTTVTYAGFWLWKQRVIIFMTDVSISIMTDFILLLLSMDFLMYVFHYVIHKTFLFRVIHSLHHQSADPKPIDLFILHPIETLSFGGLWLMLLLLYNFNIYAVMAYLIANVIFGMIGHLGIEPLPERIRNNRLMRYVGSSTFHHQHHQNGDYNLGFYTSVWDRVFGTYRDHI